MRAAAGKRSGSTLVGYIKLTSRLQMQITAVAWFLLVILLGEYKLTSSGCCRVRPQRTPCRCIIILLGEYVMLQVVFASSSCRVRLQCTVYHRGVVFPVLLGKYASTVVFCIVVYYVNNFVEFWFRRLK